jgi:hypothetical protein
MRQQRSKTHQASQTPRRTRRIHDEAHDPFAAHEKPRDPTVCPRCGALFRRGRWMWGEAPADAHASPCPACRRIEEGYPAGVVVAEGAFVAAHLDEIRGLAANLEEREKAEHPLKRILAVHEEGGRLRIETTDHKLAEAIGGSLHAAYAGELVRSPAEPGDLVRLTWRRD